MTFKLKGFEKMRLLIGQPKRSASIMALKNLIKKDLCDCILFPEGYIHGEKDLHEISGLAGQFKTAIVTSYLSDEDGKDQGVLINEYGDILFKRSKSGVEGPLLEPSSGMINNLRIGYMLCCEFFLEYDGLKESDIIFNPIGVGMFSEEQFETWCKRAKEIAIKTESLVIGVSHSDGSYRNCGFSIPIAFGYDRYGERLFMRKNETKTFIVDLESKSIEFVE